MQENRSGPELSNAVAQEIGVHRGRLARIRHLRALYQEQGNAERIRRLDELRQTELQRYDRLMSAARGRLDERQVRRIEAAGGGPLPTAEVENVERNQ